MGIESDLWLKLLALKLKRVTLVKAEDIVSLTTAIIVIIILSNIIYIYFLKVYAYLNWWSVFFFNWFMDTKYLRGYSEIMAQRQALAKNKSQNYEFFPPV